MLISNPSRAAGVLHLSQFIFHSAIHFPCSRVVRDGNQVDGCADLLVWCGRGGRLDAAGLWVWGKMSIPNSLRFQGWWFLLMALR